LGFHHQLKHGLKRCTWRSCFHSSNRVLKTIAQGVRIEGGLCEFARAQQRDQSLGFGFSSYIKTWLKALRPTCFHNSNGVFKTLAQAARIEGGVCEFARTQQQHQSLGFSQLPRSLQNHRAGRSD
jgi:hypothetical protein